MSTQKQIIIDQLETKGEISRNWCLERYISRLGALIQDLEYKGWEFKTENRDGDYVYVLVKDPRKLDPNVYKPEVIKEREFNYRNPKLI